MRIPLPMQKLLRELTEERVPHLYNLYRRTFNNDPTLPTHFNKPAPYYWGLLQATYSEIEDILHRYKAYSGYHVKETCGDTEMRIAYLSKMDYFYSGEDIYAK